MGNFTEFSIKKALSKQEKREL